MRVFWLLRSSAIAALAATLAACSVSSAERPQLDADIQRTVDKCQALAECREAAAIAKGMLVMPDVSKGALVLGGSYGEGALLEGGDTIDYYSVVGTSIGLQLGYRERAGIFMFMTPSALANFKELSGWDARRNFGLTVGPSVEDMEVVSGQEIGLIDGAPAYGFVVADSGLMADASWNALKLTRLTVEP